MQRLQHFDPEHEPHLRAVWTWMWLMVAAGAVNFIISIVCFAAFYHLSHLGWTILSNQCCIITMRMLAEFYESRVLTAVNRITADQQKAGTSGRSNYRTAKYCDKRVCVSVSVCPSTSMSRQLQSSLHQSDLCKKGSHQRQWRI